MSQRVVITGLGVVSPVGNCIGDFWQSLVNGKSGISKISTFDTSEYPTQIAGEIKECDFRTVLDEKEIRRTDRFILLAMKAADEAFKNANLDFSNLDPERCGVIVGSGFGGIQTLEGELEKLFSRGPRRVSPFLIPMMISDMASGMISIKYNFKGINYAVTSACASAAHSIADAAMAIRAGVIDCAITGGSEAPISKTGLAGFCSMKAMSTRNDIPEKASCPFDKKRDGFVMGEGSGIVILESLEHALRRNAPIIGEFAGFGLTGDAYHLSHPAPEGEGAARAMKNALRMAGIAPNAVDYINAHGTSTELNDMYESAAIMGTFGDYAHQLHISSTKSMTGHLLGASGAIEFIASALAVSKNIIPPTINYEDPDPRCPLNYTPNTSVSKTVNCAMSNSFGFGGHNASLIIKKYAAKDSTSL